MRMSPRKIIFLFTACFLLLSTRQVAADSLLCSGCLKVDVEAIFFKPQIDNPYYAIVIPDTAAGFEGTRYANDSNFQAGFRLGASLSVCCGWESVGIQWTRLHTSYDDSVVGSIFLPSSATIGSSFSDIKLNYDAVDLLYRRKFTQDCLCLAGGFGIHFASLKFDYSNDTFLNETPGLTLLSFSQNSHAYGVGPEIYLEGSYNPCGGCFGFTASARAALLATYHWAETETGGAFVADIEDQSIWRVVPYFDLRGGLQYAGTCCGTPFTAEIGYEFILYTKALSSIQIARSATPTISLPVEPTNYSDVSYQGPYLRVNVLF